MLEEVKKSLEASPIVKKGDYNYFVNEYAWLNWMRKGKTGKGLFFCNRSDVGG